MSLNDFITLHLDLVNLKINKKGSRICINKNCNKRANFNYISYKELKLKQTIYCKNHKLINMIDVINKKCHICNNKQPNFNYIGEKIALYCQSCKLENMIDIKNKKCIKCNIKQPIYNLFNQKKALYCKDCRLPEMINILDKKCIKCNNKIPSCNYYGEKIALYCGECKLTDMVNIMSKKCIRCNNKYPSCNYYNEKKALYCEECKLEGMFNIKSKRCKTYNCNLFIKKKFKGYCLRCFIYKFPESKIIRDYGTREAKVTEFIKKEFKNLNITYNKTIDGGCSKNRPDIFIDCLTHSVIIEVDENQHKAKSYTPECEIQRVNNLFTDLADRPIIFIRFNPDSYTNSKNKLIKSCFEYTEYKGLPKANKTLQSRLNKLNKEIERNIKIIPDTNITTIKLFYDGY